MKSFAILFTCTYKYNSANKINNTFPFLQKLIYSLFALEFNYISSNNNFYHFFIFILFNTTSRKNYH
ncbi:hypothetical protein [Spiroplasma endosymbiont of Tipula paludosa]|uniref:hypothetical protein n=1 Tax=Spiroplasma endosymbiont of Tipula paludosa TaxID=3066295 RepID=UPI0035C936E3